MSQADLYSETLAPAAAAAAAAAAPQLSPEDEELLALAEQPMSQAHAADRDSAAQAAAAASIDQPGTATAGKTPLTAEDEELLALAEQPLSQPQAGFAYAAGRPGTGTEQPQGDPAGLQLILEDEELLALAEQPLSQAAEKAALGAENAAAAIAGSDQQGTPLGWEKPELSPEDVELLALAEESQMPASIEESHAALTEASLEQQGTAAAGDMQPSPEGGELLALVDACSSPDEAQALDTADAAAEGSPTDGTNANEMRVHKAGSQAAATCADKAAEVRNAAAIGHLGSQETGGRESTDAGGLQRCEKDALRVKGLREEQHSVAKPMEPITTGRDLHCSEKADSAAAVTSSSVTCGGKENAEGLANAPKHQIGSVSAQKARDGPSAFASAQALQYSAASPAETDGDDDSELLALL